MNENELKSIERYFNKFNEDAASSKALLIALNSYMLY